MKTAFRSTAFAIILLALTGISQAHADCTPAADYAAPHTRTDFIKGGLVYDLTANVLKTCDGTNWNTVAAGSSLSGGTSGYLGVWSGTSSIGLSSTTAGQNLFWDASNHRLGVGTTTPQSLLQVTGGIQLGDDTAACPGASNVKAGTLRYNAGALQLCTSAGWNGITGGSGSSILNGWPDAISCSDGTVKVVLYLGYDNYSSGYNFYYHPGGAASYPFLGFTKSSGAYYGNGMLAGYDCVNKSISTLVSEAKTYNFLGGSGGGGGGLSHGVAGALQFSGGSGAFLSDDGNLHWDNTNKRLGIGTASPSYQLHLRSATPYVAFADTDDANGSVGTITSYQSGAMYYDANQNNTASPGAHFFRADGTTKNLLTILNNGNVGIGTTTPSFSLDVVGSAGAGFRSTSSQIRLFETDNADPADAWHLSMNGADLTFLYADASGGPSYTTSMVLKPTGNVGIGITNPSHILQINGQGRSTVAAWATSSDRRVKTDIEPITGGLDLIDKIRPVTFEYTAEYKAGKKDMNGVRRGFIAQEVEAVLPSMVQHVSEKVGDHTIADFRLLNTADFTPLVVSAIKQLKADNDDLRAQLKAANDNEVAQDAALDELRGEIEALKAAH